MILDDSYTVQDDSVNQDHLFQLHVKEYSQIEKKKKTFFNFQMIYMICNSFIDDSLAFLFICSHSGLTNWHTPQNSQETAITQPQHNHNTATNSQIRFLLRFL